MENFGFFEKKLFHLARFFVLSLFRTTLFCLCRSFPRLKKVEGRVVQEREWRIVEKSLPASGFRKNAVDTRHR